MSEERGPGEKGKRVEDIRKEAEEKACPVQRALYFIEEFIAGPMCSKCYPCSLGTGEAKIRLMRISRHLENAAEADIRALRRIGLNMAEGASCKKGRDTGKFIADVLSVSGEEIRQHLAGICPKKECVDLIRYVIQPELCIMCGKCSEVCEAGAIIGEKKQSYLSGFLPFEIRQKRCTRCGACVGICPTGAISAIAVPKEEPVGKE
jgi:ferredoxin